MNLYIQGDWKLINVSWKLKETAEIERIESNATLALVRRHVSHNASVYKGILRLEAVKAPDKVIYRHEYIEHKDIESLAE